MFYVFRIMKVILSNMCASLVGTLERGLGYHLEHRKNGFFSKRDQRGSVPPDGHLRFIFLCAEMAHNHLYISDIEVTAGELDEALSEAGLALGANPPSLSSLCSLDVRREVLSASDILSIRSNLIRQNPSGL